jgi:hypothetical protein
MSYNIVKKVFPVKTYNNDLCIDHDVPAKYRPEIIRNSWQFIWGKTTKIEYNVQRLEYLETKVPLDATNLIKHYIVTSTPSLNFGWLAPKYQTFDIPQTVIHSKTYVNVIPLEQYQKEDTVTFLTMENPKCLTQNQ